jgi:polyhydroxybutyrate depolymerase
MATYSKLLFAFILAIASCSVIGCGDGDHADDSGSTGGTGGGGGSPPPPPPPPPPPGGSGTGGTGGTAGTFDKTTVINGITRTYRLYVPTSAMTALASGPVPMVVGWHGAGDTGANFIAATGLTSNASSNAYILVGPQGYNNGWFISTAEGWPGTDGYTNSYPNDLAFANKIKDEVGALYNVETKRIYSCGFSRGAGFNVLMAEASGNPGVLSGSWTTPFAAYGICAGYDPFGGSLNMANASPKRPCWLIHGTSDSVVPFSQGQSAHNALTAAGFTSTFTSVSGAPHNWLWAPVYSHSNQELYDWFMANPIP